MLYASAEAMCLHENFRMRTMFVYDVSLGLVDLCHEFVSIDDGGREIESNFQIPHSLVQIASLDQSSTEMKVYHCILRVERQTTLKAGDGSFIVP